MIAAKVIKMKRCTGCGVLREATLENFGTKGRPRAHLLRSRCKECCKETYQKLKSTPEGRAGIAARQKKYRSKPEVKEIANARHRRRRLATKIGAIRKYGGKCKCCGERDPFFLTIDHVNSDGGKHRKLAGSKARSFYLHKWLCKNPRSDNYQVLCFNCNCGRGLNDGVCPHKDQSLKIKVKEAILFLRRVKEI